MQTIELQRKWGMMESDVERMRRAFGGTFGVMRRKIVRDYGKRILRIEQMEDWGYSRNIVTNQGLNALLGIMLHADTQITTWYVALSKTNTTPLSTHTYASPGFTEVTTTNVDEATRQAWVEAAAASQSITNSASPAVYIGDDTFTAYGCALVGGGSAATTIGDTAGGGTMYCSALFGTSKSMALDVQLQITYTLTAADDGV